MEIIILRFPGLAQQIFNKLDDQSLSNSKNVSRSISSFMNREVFFLKRIIQKYTNNIDDFKDAWRTVLNKAGKNNVQELAFAVNHFLSTHPSSCTDKNPEDICNHRNDSYSPLHISSEAGNYNLCQFIIGRTKEKNPTAEGDHGLTPLHKAAENGYLEICKLIMNNVQEKNPKEDKLGKASK